MCSFLPPLAARAQASEERIALEQAKDGAFAEATGRLEARALAAEEAKRATELECERKLAERAAGGAAQAEAYAEKVLAPTLNPNPRSCPFLTLARRPSAEEALCAGGRPFSRGHLALFHAGGLRPPGKLCVCAGGGVSA